MYKRDMEFAVAVTFFNIFLNRFVHFSNSIHIFQFLEVKKIVFVLSKDKYDNKHFDCTSEP